MLAPIVGKDTPQVEGCDLADLLLRDSPEAVGEAVGRRERMEDTSSTSSLVEVELVERTTTSTPEDAVARFVPVPFHHFTYSLFHHFTISPIQYFTISLPQGSATTWCTGRRRRAWSSRW